MKTYWRIKYKHLIYSYKWRCFYFFRPCSIAILALPMRYKGCKYTMLRHFCQAFYGFFTFEAFLHQ